MTDTAFAGIAGSALSLGDGPESEDQLAQLAADKLGFEAPQVRLLTRSENATYLAEDRTHPGRCAIVRVHRPGYHDRASIESELAWLQALGQVPGLTVAPPRALVDGSSLLEVDGGSGPRYVSVFEFVTGRCLDGVAVQVEHFALLGSIAALLHENATVAGTSNRFAWDWNHTLGNEPRWGQWQDGPGVTPHLTVLSKAESTLKQRLETYGMGPGRYGLIHSDLRLANLIESDGQITVIDFDDCGFGWFMYDFASAVSFLETDPQLPEWAGAWVRGYQSVRDLPASDQDMLPDMVMLRRLMLLAWLGTHPQVREAAALASHFAAGTATIASAYLADTLLRKD